MIKPIISVVIPTFNRAELVSRAVRSVLDNSTPAEVVVVDDGSTDETESKLRELGIAPVRQDKAGATAARNRGSEHASGDWLVFLDSDDEFTGNAVEIFVRQIVSSDNVGVVCTAAEILGPTGESRSIRKPRDLGGSYNHQTGLFLAGTFAVRREIFRALGGFSVDCQANQHKEFALRLVPYCDEHGFKIVHTDAVTVRVHEHSGEHLRSNMSNLLDGSVYIINHHEQQLRKCPKHFADWCSITAVYAAKLRRWRTARELFYKSVLTAHRPTDFVRWCVAALPGIRRHVWKA